MCTKFYSMTEIRSPPPPKCMYVSGRSRDIVENATFISIHIRKKNYQACDKFLSKMWFFFEICPENLLEKIALNFTWFLDGRFFGINARNLLYFFSWALGKFVNFNVNRTDFRQCCSKREKRRIFVNFDV